MRIERVEFAGGSGHPVAGRLELPAETPRGYALLAHGFADGEDSPIAARFSRTLAAGGLAVLSLHLGATDDGDLDATVADLVAAGAHLREHHRAPVLLLGHGLAGVAALGATEELREVRAVVTVGAPAEPERLPRAGTPLLVLHSPVDEVLGIENARELFDRARHPKSFVAIDGSDHQLSRESDAWFAASVAGAWAARYLDEAGPRHSPEGPVAGEVTVVENGAGPYGQDVLAGRHTLRVDEPQPIGKDTGPSPYDLVLAGLGACTSMTIRMYAERKKWPLEKVSVTLRHSRIHADDCSSCETETGKLDHVERVVLLEGELTDEQRTKLLDIADRCPVHRTLHSEIVVETALAEGR